MRIKKRISESSGIPLTVWLEANLKPIIFIISFITGILIGSLISSRLSTAGFVGIESIIKKLIANREEQSALKTFSSALLPNAVVWVAVFISGFCAISAPVTVMIPCARGMHFGIQACSLLLVLSYDGIKYISLHMLPNLIISAITISLCCCDSLEMSKYFWHAIDPLSRLQNNSITTPVFCGKMLVYAIIIIFGAIIEAYSYIVV